ncbi:MAG: hypothetical protein VBE63_22790 [Lamprobacter sp.]|uniref:hypothetical protein n=1 Tax=Lamprobacter sp. TaxID=3100796 RepID=UPI002B2590DA|nr:hypothetical protein [Lamprobacter sp.]MEA3642741.1 hypothetical protein [Lamprobacter sp.]
MESMQFDSLRYERQLRDAGVPEAQAEVHANTMADAFGFWARNIVTKDYLDAKLEGLAASIELRMAERFAEQEVRFEKRFSAIDERFSTIDQRFVEQDLKFEKRFHRINLQFYILMAIVLVNSFGGAERLLRLLPL